MPLCPNSLLALYGEYRTLNYVVLSCGLITLSVRYDYYAGVGNQIIEREASAVLNWGLKVSGLPEISISSLFNPSFFVKKSYLI